MLRAGPGIYIGSCNAAGCAVPRASMRSALCGHLVSCNGDGGKRTNFPVRSGPCGSLVSCNARAVFGCFCPGLRLAARQACTRWTCWGPQKYCWFSGFCSHRRWLARLLAARHIGSEQYICWPVVRGSQRNSFWQHRQRRRRVFLTRLGPFDPHHA